jgi:hypothetical protein
MSPKVEEAMGDVYNRLDGIVKLRRTRPYNIVSLSYSKCTTSSNKHRLYMMALIFVPLAVHIAAHTIPILSPGVSCKRLLQIKSAKTSTKFLKLFSTFLGN